ncbi:MAG: hypothetical protein AAFQ80_07365 [Cyanobacteria bacterium J06621_8]
MRSGTIYPYYPALTACPYYPALTGRMGGRMGTRALVPSRRDNILEWG